MKCASPKCPNRGHPGRNRGFCGKHYDTAPMRGYVDPTKARERIDLLRSRGMTLRMLADHGVSRFGVRCIETHSRIRVMTEAKVLAIPVPKPLLSGAPVDATGTCRRLRALMWMGYTTTLIGAELGVRQNSVSAIAQRQRVTAGTRAAVADLFERWCMTPGPSRITAERARRAGWCGPLSWNDIDDPFEQPEVPQDRHVSFPERLAELEYLHIPRSEMPKWLGIQDESFERQLSRYQIKEAV